MIEPTDEMVQAFREGYAPYDRPLDSDAVEVGLAAVLEIVERDYEIKRRVCGNRGFAGASGCWRELGHEGNHLWSRPDGTS